MTELENYVSKNGVYIIPVEWSVYSTVVVKGVNNLQEALDAVKTNMDDIPLSHHPEYIESSYTVPEEDADNLITAQDYQSRGVLLEMNGSSFDTVILD